MISTLRVKLDYWVKLDYCFWRAHRHSKHLCKLKMYFNCKLKVDFKSTAMNFGNRFFMIYVSVKMSCLFHEAEEL